MSYTFKLDAPTERRRMEANRRLALLESIAAVGEPITAQAMASKTELADLRWLWDRSMIEVVAACPLRYAVSLAGQGALDTADMEREKAEARMKRKEAA